MLGNRLVAQFAQSHLLPFRCQNQNQCCSYSFAFCLLYYYNSVLVPRIHFASARKMLSLVLSESQSGADLSAKTKTPKNSCLVVIDITTKAGLWSRTLTSSFWRQRYILDSILVQPLYSHLFNSANAECRDLLFVLFAQRFRHTWMTDALLGSSSVASAYQTLSSRVWFLFQTTSCMTRETSSTAQWCPPARRGLLSSVTVP